MVANGSATFNSTGGQATLATPISNFVLLDYDGDDDSAGAPAFLLGGLDLTDGGMNNVFVLDIASLAGGTINFNVRITTGVAGVNTSQANGSINSAGLYEVAFSNLSAGAGDVSSVDRLTFRFDLESGQSITLNQISADASSVSSEVPEPGSAALLGLGLAAIAFWRRKSR